ncbi:unnamed protein product [Lupinus luteus]|uniref:Zeaxanthin epoxidase, chloroplastic n=1 Tax=Lupinus luteus TaxID=3873 RepID=A0AAV1WYB7_LUPLU
MASSTLCHHSLNPSMASFTTTHFSIPMYKKISLHMSPFVNYGYHLGNTTTKKITTLKAVKAKVAEEAVSENDGTPQKKKLRVLVAGGGIGGLVFALAAKRVGFEVVVFERDMSAIRGEGQYRGPIQIQSNALAALESIDPDVANQVMRVGCITGDRINGLVDGISGSWYVKFDTFTPAVEHGLPVTRVISRLSLQEILARAVGEDIIMNGSNVVDFVDHGNKVTVQLEDGQKYDGDLLVGADGKRERLLKLFEGWCDNVIDLLHATEEQEILRRDIYDRTPTMTWGKGSVTLLGDSIHAMQPNMGQGGCMAIEDSYQLAWELNKAWEQSIKSGSPIDIHSSLKSYEKERRIRVAIVHGMARMAAQMATTYRPYLGIGLGPLEFLSKFKIPHPGTIGGKFIIDKVMPSMLRWVLGGNSSKLKGRPQSCRVTDKANDQLQKWFKDDDALERAINGEWFLLPCGNEAGFSEPICLSQDEMKPYIIGSKQQESYLGNSILISLPKVSETHARINYKDGAFFLTDLRGEYGTWITDNEKRRYRLRQNYPTRLRSSYVVEFGSDKASFRVKVTRSAPRVTEKEGTQNLQAV